MSHLGKKKILTLPALKRVIATLNRKKKVIVFTNGCFDIIHVGHVRYLSKAKSLGDILVVGLNSDVSTKKLKGLSRPIMPEGERAEILSALEAVDYVVVFKDPTPIRLIEGIEPDVLVKGADWSGSEIVGSDIVIKRGGKVVRVRLAKGRSTTNIIEKIRKSK